MPASSLVAVELGQVLDEALDDEQPARVKDLRDVTEAVDLSPLAGHVEQRVEHQVSQLKAARHRHVGHVTDDRRDRRAAGLRAHLLDHRC